MVRSSISAGSFLTVTDDWTPVRTARASVGESVSRGGPPWASSCLTNASVPGSSVMALVRSAVLIARSLSHAGLPASPSGVLAPTRGADDLHERGHNERGAAED